MEFLLRILRMGLMQGASRFGSTLVSSPAFHRLVHSTNKTIFGLLKRVSEKPEVAEQTEKLKQAMQNQSSFVKEKAAGGECFFCNWLICEATKAANKKTTSQPTQKSRYAPGERADWFTRTYQTYKYQFDVWRQSRKQKKKE